MPTEYQLKAAQLFNIAKFVEWPRRAFESETSPLILGVLGKDPFGADLDTILQGRTINGRKVVVKRAATVKELIPSHILFVSSSEEKRVRQVLEEMASLPVLTVGDLAGFPESGGILFFTMEGKRVRFEINRSSADRASLKFSAQLLKLAHRIRGGPAN